MSTDPRWALEWERLGLLESPAVTGPRPETTQQVPGNSRVVPIPPSTNHLFATVRGKRIKSKKYKAWIEEALYALHGWRWKGAYPVAIELTIREKVNALRDADNFLKPTLDALVAAGVIQNDSLKYVCRVVVQYAPLSGDGVKIEIK